MSMRHWVCEGIGIRTDKLYPYLDTKKCIRELKKQLPDETIRPDGFDIDDYFYGNPFNDMGEFLYHLDDSDTMTYGDNGDGEHYFYYPPNFPWAMGPNEPKTIEDVHRIIINAVMKICNVDEDVIERMIEDDLYEYGCG